MGRSPGSALLRRAVHEAGLAGGAGEQPIVTDAVEPTRQDMEQEAADELVGGKRHGALAIDTAAAIVLT